MGDIRARMGLQRVLRVRREQVHRGGVQGGVAWGARGPAHTQLWRGAPEQGPGGAVYGKSKARLRLSATTFASRTVRPPPARPSAERALTPVARAC